ncbi:MULTISPECIES: hypothetical protein [Cohnella]|uniref:hypothetical protein n=1 Tax=Cohnella TaxID=329857 RepID=UPI0009BC1A94|nr:MULTISPECIES: hypothetical protein [Cohnella]MBN2984792.1 hypothetical protein [Cohnella algarum]
MGQLQDRIWVESQFAASERLGITLPCLAVPWESLSRSRQSLLLEAWERIRGTIPDRIFAFEEQIKRLQEGLYEEEDFEESCRLNGAIAELASRINDLHIWYRTQQDMDEERRKHS